MPRNKLIVVVLVGAGLFAGTAISADTADESPAQKPVAAGAEPEAAEPHVARGRVVDSRGEPIPGAVVTVDHTLFYNANIQARTARDGTYRVGVPQGSYRATASLTREYHGKKYRFDLHPETAEDFAGSDGAVRNFVWKLSGDKPEGSSGTYGGFVVAYTEPGDFSMDMTDVELTLTPDGHVVDGGKGEPVTRKLVSTADGWAVQDVPVGRYRIAARHAPEGKKPVRIRVRQRNTGQYVDTLTADFATPNGPNLAIHRIELEVKKP